MQVTETLTDGLKREFQVSIPASDLEARVAGRLSELKDRVQLRGFRPGKVPVTHLRKIYGRSVMAETIEAVIRELNAKIVEERGLKLAMEPRVTLPEGEGEVENIIGGKSDLAYKVALEVLPKIELGDFSSIQLDRLVAEVSDAEVEEAMGKFADQNKPFVPKGRAQRSRTATASSSISPARSTASRSKAAAVAMCPSMLAPAPSFPVSRTR